MTHGLVSLPMYNWPDLYSAHTLFYAHLKQRLEDHGFAAPNTLDWSSESLEKWQDPQLLLSQTCGLPFVTVLKNQVSLVGTPTYEIAGEDGDYYSVIVVPKNAPAQGLEDLRDARFVYNDRGSQSGFAAACHAFSSVTQKETGSIRAWCSGSHRASILAVAAGRADFAAIDAVTWEIAKRHEVAAASLRVLAVTEPTPGLPYITALRPAAETRCIFGAVTDAISSVGPDTRQALFLTGFKKTVKEDYQIIESRIENNGNLYLFKDEDDTERV